MKADAAEATTRANPPLATAPWVLAHTRNRRGIQANLSRAIRRIRTAKNSRLIACGRTETDGATTGIAASATINLCRAGARMVVKEMTMAAVAAAAVRRDTTGLPPAQKPAYAAASHSHEWFGQGAPAIVCV